MLTRSLTLIALASLLALGCDDEPTVDAGTDGGGANADGGSTNADSGAPDAGSAGTCADVAGTYDYVWTPDPANSVDCPAPMDTVQITDDGLDTGSPASTCSTTGCDETNCVREVVGASCEASFSASGPCASLGDGRTISTASTFDGTGMVTTTVSDTMTPAAGACAFTGVGTRR